MKPSYLKFEEPGRELLTAIGAVTVIAVWAEAELIWLLAGLGQMRFNRARALFYSTASAKARLDMIRALIPQSGVPEGVAYATAKVLDKAAALADRRNELMHGQISEDEVHPGAMFIITRKTATSQPRRSRSIKAAEVWTLTQEYGELMRSLGDLSNDISFPASRDAWRGKYPPPPPKAPPQKSTREPRKAQRPPPRS